MNSATVVARAKQETRQSLTDRILESLSVDRHHGLRETLAAELEHSRTISKRIEMRNPALGRSTPRPATECFPSCRSTICSS